MAYCTGCHQQLPDGELHKIGGCPPETDKPTVKLIGEDGNVFNLIGKTVKALRRAGQPEAAKTFSETAFKCGSYDEVLALIMDYCEVE